MDVDSIKNILKDEYGINSIDEFNEAADKFSGVNIGIFITPLERRK